MTLAQVRLPRTALPPLAPGKYYVEDVVGCAVEDEAGHPLGAVRGTFWNGAHDVATVIADDGRERMIARWCPSSCWPSILPDESCGCAWTTSMSTEPAPRQTAPPQITFEIVTLFPELFDGLFATTVIGKAIGAGVVAVHRTNPRDFGLGRYRQVDDTPYGGGPGMVMRVEPDRGGPRRHRRRAGPVAPDPAHRPGPAFDQRGPRARVGAAPDPGLRSLRGGRRTRVALVDDELGSATSSWRAGSWPPPRCWKRRPGWFPGSWAAGSLHDEESFSAGRLEYPH